jgi:DNA-binding transcriptional LysR family regulator
MTLAQLRAFLAAYDRGSFSAAGEQLESSQAGVSELVARLEHELNVRLFVRGRRLVPTAAAEELRRHAALSVSAADSGTQAINAMNSLQGGVCTFGVPRNAAYYDLADLAQRFHRRYPNVKVRLVGLNSALVAGSIASGEVEAGLIVLPVREANLKLRPLIDDEVVYVSATRKATGPVTIEEFARAKLVLYDAYAGWRDPTRLQIQQRASLRGLTIDPEIEVEHVETALGLVASGAADSIVASAIASGRTFSASIRTFPFDPPLYDTLALAAREDTSLSPATQRIIRLVEDTIRARARRSGMITRPYEPSKTGTRSLT